MHHKVDLDDLKSRLEPDVTGWRERLDVGPFTWRDEAAPWPQPITADRASVKLPESLGLVVQRGDDEARICVWTGGWADVDVAIGDEASALCPEFEDVDGAHAAVVSVVEDFRRRVLGGMTSGAEGG